MRACRARRRRSASRSTASLGTPCQSDVTDELPILPIPHARRLRRTVLGCGAVLGLAMSLICVGIAWVLVQELRDPSGKVYVETGDGRVELPLPVALSTPPT